MDKHAILSTCHGASETVLSSDCDLFSAYLNTSVPSWQTRVFLPWCRRLAFHSTGGPCKRTPLRERARADTHARTHTHTHTHNQSELGAREACYHLALKHTFCTPVVLSSSVARGYARQAPHACRVWVKRERARVYGVCTGEEVTLL